VAKATNKVLLIDVDSKIPNLALMKLSTHFKALGVTVDFIQLGYSGYPHKKEPTFFANTSAYQKIYASIIFQHNKGMVVFDDPGKVMMGGSGYCISKTLPNRIDDLQEDYSLYPNNEISYGFITRGCIRKCSFCLVPEKEGKIKFYRPISRIVRHKRTHFLDNNILAYKKCSKILKRLARKKIRCQFNQGLDIRLITKENARLLSRLNYDGEYTFAFDDLKLESLITKRWKILKKVIQLDWKIRFFIYCHPDMELSDVIARAEWCREHKVKPYIMRDASCYDSPRRNFYTDFAGYCNQPAMFKNKSFRDFLLIRTPDVKRQKKSARMYERAL
jgi:hypothetical protein